MKTTTSPAAETTVHIAYGPDGHIIWADDYTEETAAMIARLTHGHARAYVVPADWASHRWAPRVPRWIDLPTKVAIAA